MATATVRQAVPQLGSTAIPNSVIEALEQGWSVVSEDTKASRKGDRRCGSIILSRDGRRISAFYFADKDGYRFGAIKAVR